MRKHIVTTADGSQSVLIEEWEEQYHSRHGARQESQHVFINTGLAHIALKAVGQTIKVLEIGFGTGLNALLTAEYAKQNNLQISYTGLEAFPLESEIINGLTFAESEKGKAVFKSLHDAPWNEDTHITTEFRLVKYDEKIQAWKGQESYHICYYDAFAPRVQPEMWTLQIFEQLFQIMLKSGVLVTYCAKGQVRRDMEAAGFKVERLPGPPGKREMLRATKV